jgi:hypothetical protein
MNTEADHLIASILHANDDFLIEVGRLTLLFARIEDALALGIFQLAEVVSKGELLVPAERQKVMQLRLLDKRKLLKNLVVELSRFYVVDCTRVLEILDDLGDLNKVRRTVVHGFIRWSSSDERPVFLDSHGNNASAWPWDVSDANQEVMTWSVKYYKELGSVLRAVLETIDHFADRLLNQHRFDSKTRGLIRSLKSQVADSLREGDAEAE